MHAHGLQQGLHGCLHSHPRACSTASQRALSFQAAKPERHARRVHAAAAVAERDLNGVIANGASSNGASPIGSRASGNGALPHGERVRAQGLGESSNISAKLMPFLLRLAHIT